LKKILFLVLVFCFSITSSAFATPNEANDQITKRINLYSKDKIQANGSIDTLSAVDVDGHLDISCVKGTRWQIICDWDAELYSDQITRSNLVLSYWVKSDNGDYWLSTGYDDEFKYPVIPPNDDIRNQGSETFTNSPGTYRGEMEGSVFGWLGEYVLEPIESYNVILN
jgi:hypothetical protein